MSPWSAPVAVVDPRALVEKLFAGLKGSDYPSVKYCVDNHVDVNACDQVLWLLYF